MIGGHCLSFVPGAVRLLEMARWRMSEGVRECVGFTPCLAPDLQRYTRSTFHPGSKLRMIRILAQAEQSKGPNVFSNQTCKTMRHFFTLLFSFACAIGMLSAQDAEYGLASYYADKFAGKRTASGELYDPAKMTAAHKTHPFGTILRVTRLDNGKSVEVRVNDRGPYVAGRVVDVSRAAAEKLDLIRDGRARVKVEVVRLPGETARRVESKKMPATPLPEKRAEPEVTTYDAPARTTPARPATPATGEKASKPKPRPQPRKPAAPAKKKETMSAKGGTLVKQFKPLGVYRIRLEHPEAGGYGVQVASLTTTEGVLRQIADLQAKWFDEILLKIEERPTGKPLYKIILGSFETRKEAEAYKESLRKKYRIEGFVVPLRAE